MTAVTSARPARRYRHPIPWAKIASFIILGLEVFVCIYPLLWMVFATLKPYKELMTSRYLLPQVWTISTYIEIFERPMFQFAMRNSVYMAAVTVISVLFTSTGVGYVFAKFHFWGKEALFTALLATMMIPFAVMIVPLYIVIVDIGLANKLWGVMITGLMTTFGIFMMRQFMNNIPKDLFDAARVDGAGEWYTFFRLVVPLSTAPMGTLGVFTFLGSWDNFLWPLIVLNAPEKQTLPLFLNGLRSLFWSRYDMWATGSLLTVVPALALYLIASKFFVRSIATTGMK